MSRVYVSTFKQMPTESHWVIIRYTQVFEPGYTENDFLTKDIVRYEAFTDEKDWKKEIEELTGHNEKFSAYFANVAKVSVKVQVDISTDR